MFNNKYNKIFIIVFALFMVLFLTSCSNDEVSDPVNNEPYTVSGRVVDMDGTGLDGVKVISSDGSNAVTGEEGNWTLTELKGEVKLSLAESGLPDSIKVSGEKENINFIKCRVPEADVDTRNINQNLSTLTSEELNGRLPGFPGNKAAEDLIAEYFNNLNLNSPASLGDYRQEFNQDVVYPVKASKLQIKDTNDNIVVDYQLLKDFAVQPNWPNTTINGKASGDVYLYSNKDSIDQTGKIMMVSNEKFEEIGGLDFFNEVEAAKNNGVKGIIIERPKQEREYYMVKRYVKGPYYEDGKAPILYYANSSVYNEIKAQCQEDNYLYMESNYELKATASNNIIGYIPGKTDQYLLISAHFDGLGENGDGSYNQSALDNASGTVAMMEIARFLTENYDQPEKNIVFIGFNAEEEGLLGSQHYANNPVFPLDKTMLINLDMVGSAAEDSIPLKIYSKEGDNKIKDVLYNLLNTGYNFNVNKENGVASDDAHFDNGITLIRDDPEYYHSPLDTTDRVDVERMAKIIKSVLTYILNEVYTTSMLDISRLAA